MVEWPSSSITVRSSSGIPGNLLASYVYDLAKKFRNRMDGRKRGPIFEIRVERTPTSRNTTVKIDTAHASDLEAALRQVPEILRAEATSAFWDDANNRYNEIAINDRTEP